MKFTLFSIIAALTLSGAITAHAETSAEAEFYKRTITHPDGKKRIINLYNLYLIKPINNRYRTLTMLIKCDQKNAYVPTELGEDYDELTEKFQPAEKVTSFEDIPEYYRSSGEGLRAIMSEGTRIGNDETKTMRHKLSACRQAENERIRAAKRAAKASAND